MKKLGVVITDGVGFRNFIMSDFLAEAEKTFDEVVILSCLPKEIYTDFTKKTKVIELQVFQEKFKTWLFRKTKEIAHLRLHQKNNFGIQDSLKINNSKVNSSRGHTTRIIYLITRLFYTENWIQRFNLWQQLSFKNNTITKDYRAILEKEKFDILFFTHQRPPFIAPLVYQAEQLKIKTVSFIFSWDNLASKGRMAANFNYFLVWSDLMKIELQQFYTTVNQDNIEVVGTPQFEPYTLERYKVSKEDFVSKFNINITLKTICFSCGDISTSRNDELYIKTISTAILTHKIPNVNFIVRTSPAEDAKRFSEIAKEFPFIKWNYPKWILSRQVHQEVWSQRVPTIDDVKDLRSLLEYSDLNINMLSTMSLDFIQFNKPVINTVFGNSKNKLYDDQRFLNYAHIVNVIKSNATKIVKNETELINSINQYIENPDLDNVNRKLLLKLQVSKPINNTGKRIAETLYKWA